MEQFFSRTNCQLIRIPASTFKTVIGIGPNQIVAPIHQDLERVAKKKSFIKSVLQKTYLFQDMTEDQINFLAGTIDREYVFQPNEYIIHEGELSKSLLIIESGSVRLERIGEDGNVVALKDCHEGEVLGELSLITGLPRTASVMYMFIFLVFKKS